MSTSDDVATAATGESSGSSGKEPTQAGDKTAPSEKKQRLVALAVLKAHSDAETCDRLFWFWVFSQYGKVLRTRQFQKYGHKQFLVQYETEDDVHSAHAGLDGIVVAGHQINLLVSDKREIAMTYSARDYSETNKLIAKGELRSPFDRVWMHVEAAQTLGDVGDCVHVGGLNGEGITRQFTLEMLWNLASQYGTLLAAKMLDRRGSTGCALLQFNTSEEALRFRTLFHQMDIAMLGGRVRFLVTPSKKRNCCSWAHNRTSTTLVSTTTPCRRSLPEVGANSPSRFVVMHFMDNSMDLARVATLLKDDRVPVYASLFVHEKFQQLAAMWASVGEAFEALAVLNGVDGCFMQFGRGIDFQDEPEADSALVASPPASLPSKKHEKQIAEETRPPAPLPASQAPQAQAQHQAEWQPALNAGVANAAQQSLMGSIPVLHPSNLWSPQVVYVTASPYQSLPQPVAPALPQQAQTYVTANAAPAQPGLNFARTMPMFILQQQQQQQQQQWQHHSPL